jgi:MHS family proline/betaine transporter-like MFS transporter
MAISNILGAVVALIVRASMPEADLAAWGWRIPFLFGLIIVPVGLWLRATLGETPEFLAVQLDGNRPRPNLAMLISQRGNIARGFGISVLWGVCVYALVVFMPVHLQSALGFTANEAFTAALVGNLVLVAMCFVSGSLADRIGRKRLMTISASALLLFAPLLMALLLRIHALPVLILVQGCLCALVGLYSGAVPAALAELYPTAIRSTATSIAYNAAITIFAGFAPAIITWLTTTTLGGQAPALYVSAAALAALVAIRSFPPD